MRVVQKPWGYEEIWAETDKYVGKYLYINANHRLSRQFHEKKEETIRVLKGVLLLEIGVDETLQQLRLEVDEFYHIVPHTIHRFCAENNDVLLVEVSTPELDDVVRLFDDYSRKGTND